MPTFEGVPGAAFDLEDLTSGSTAIGAALRAALVPRPTGGSDGQALVKSGSNVVWGTVAGGGGLSVTDNTDGTATAA